MNTAMRMIPRSLPSGFSAVCTVSDALLRGLLHVSCYKEHHHEPRRGVLCDPILGKLAARGKARLYVTHPFDRHLPPFVIPHSACQRAIDQCCHRAPWIRISIKISDDGSAHQLRLDTARGSIPTASEPENPSDFYAPISLTSSGEATQFDWRIVTELRTALQYITRTAQPRMKIVYNGQQPALVHCMDPRILGMLFPEPADAESEKQYQAAIAAHIARLK